jgi:allantoin racemase
MKLLCIIVEPLDPASEKLAEWTEVGQAMMRPGDSFTVLPIASGPSEYYESDVGFSMCVPGLLQAVLEHQHDYDAILLGCFADPGLRSARAISKIPIIGPAEASASLCRLVCSRYGIVTILDEVVPDIETLFVRMEVGPHLVGAEAINMSFEEMEDAQATIASVERSSRVLLAKGAQAILLGCMSFGFGHPVSTALSERLRVPIIDPLRAGMAAALAYEMLGVEASRGWVPRIADTTALEEYLAALPTAPQPAGF